MPAAASTSAIESIHVVGAREHNLKGIDVRIPLGRLTVITGVSGSGKSSLAFDVLYAEGQRRYVESFSAYTRQFLDRMDRPQVERIDGILPAIAIDQSRPVKTSRSTVGTMTELHDHLKLLFAKIGAPHCRTCGKPVARDTPESAATACLDAHADARALVVFDLAVPAGLPWPDARAGLLAGGFIRALGPAGPVALEDLAEPPTGDVVTVVQDRLVLRPADRARLVESLEQAFRHGRGRAAVLLPDAGSTTLRFSTALACAHCGFTVREPTPNLFSFNSPLGACETCRGFGRVIDLDLDLVIPDPRRTIAGRRQAVVHQGHGLGARRAAQVLPASRHSHRPALRGARRRAARLVLDGDGRGSIRACGWFRWLEGRTYRMHVRVFLARYRSYTPCAACARRTPATRRARLSHRRPHRRRRQPHERRGGGALLRRAQARHRAGRGRRRPDPRRGAQPAALSARGRPRLSDARPPVAHALGRRAGARRPDTAVGSSLVNTLYILDEPSIGLHPRDSQRLVRILHQLRDQGNTVVVVEHDPEIIREADHVIDLGPGAGERGGEMLFAGPVAALARRPLLAHRRVPLRPAHDPGAGEAAPAHSRIVARPARGVGEQPAGSRRRHPARVLRHASPASPARASRRWSRTCSTAGCGSASASPTACRARAARSRAPSASPTSSWSTRAARHDAARQPRDLPEGLRPHPRLLRAHRDGAPARLHAGDLLVQRRRRALRDLRRRGLREGRDAVPLRRLRDLRRVQRRALPPEVLEVRWQGRTIREVLDLTVTEALELLRRDSRGARPAAAAVRRRPRLPAPRPAADHAVGRRVAAPQARGAPRARGASRTPSSSSTSRPSACTSPTSRSCSARFARWSSAATRWWSSSTTWRS